MPDLKTQGRLSELEETARVVFGDDSPALSASCAQWIADTLGENLWSKQRDILTALDLSDRVAVPSCHGAGKSHLAARIVAHWVISHAPGTAKVVTTSASFRQVRAVLWPHIRRVHSRYALPGRTNLVEWWMADEMVAFGFKSEDNDPDAV